MMPSFLYKFVEWITKYGMLIAIAVAIIFLQNPFGFIEFFTNIQINPTVEISKSAIFVTNVREVLEFNAVSKSYAEYLSPYTEVVIEGGLANNCLQGAEFAYIVQVEAGIDLSQVTRANIDPDNESSTVRLTLPSPHLTECKILDVDRYQTNEPSLRSCESHDAFFSAMGQYQVIDTVKQQAISEGILADVETHNDKLLTAFFQDLLDSEIELVYEEGEPTHDESCSPQVRGGWQATRNPNGSYSWQRNQ